MEWTFIVAFSLIIHRGRSTVKEKEKESYCEWATTS